MATVFAEPRIIPCGEAALQVEFGEGIAVEIHEEIRRFMQQLDRAPFSGMVEYIAAFASVTILYDPVLLRRTGKGETAYEVACRQVRNLLGQGQQGPQALPRTVEIPVCYGGEFGPDLAFVAEHNGLTPQEVITIHSTAQYQVYMIGFAPGFPYLGGMPESIAAPRRTTPRTLIPAGTVGIAGLQTGVYPIGTPGGWQLIGRTPLSLFCPEENPPSLLAAGDRIRFYPVSLQEYMAWEGKP